jgi:hypothetical protein
MFTFTPIQDDGMGAAETLRRTDTSLTYAREFAE